VLRILVGDIVSGDRRLDTANDPAARRDVVRTLFATVEALVWHCRRHVVGIAEELELLPAEAKAVLSESVYSVSKSGVVNKQPRFIPLLPMIRLVVRIAQKINPEIDAEFSGPDWNSFNAALALRHRLTHPKAISDLNVSEADLRSAKDATMWLLRLCELVMSQTLAKLSEHVDLLRTFTDDLRFTGKRKPNSTKDQPNPRAALYVSKTASISCRSSRDILRSRTICRMILES
jgi:hypothetical protein